MGGYLGKNSRKVVRSTQINDQIGFLHSIMDRLFSLPFYLENESYKFRMG